MMIRTPRQVFLYVQLTFLFLFVVPGLASETERPFIWVKSTDRPAILKKIEEHPWARSLFVELGVRADEAAPTTMAERRQKLMDLPLVWSEGEDSPPALVVFPRENPFADGRQDQATAITKGLQDGIDCGVMFYLTGKENYAQCAADILFTFVNALPQIEPNREYTTNGGWLYQGNHLREVRIVSAQIPIIYDFVQPWLKKGGKAYDLASGELRDFDFEALQDIFRTYIWLALNHGLYDSNWPALESPGLVHNILGLDDAQERADTLPYYLTRDTEHKFEHWSRGQPSLERIAKKFKNPGDVWPESLGYSVHVASNLVYVMTLFDRLYPDLGLGKRYRNIPAALTSFYDLRFPNGDTPYIGDGSRRQHVSFHTYEKALQLAVLNNNTDQAGMFGDLLTASMADGQYDRAALAPKNYGWSHYLTPLQLLWFLDDPDGDPLSDAAPPHPRTNHLPHAGMYIQRNVSKTEPVTGSLMAYVAGGSYIHGHASGMEMELYGQGHVLGINNGNAKYGTAIHENYYRLFAAKNTVISNGASASSGGWIELGVNTVNKVAMEPEPNQAAVSPNHSFSTTSFYDEFNLLAPAEQQRTIALVKLSDTSGFYLDVFRARSDTPKQFHDYLYHNVGDTLSIQSGGKPLQMTDDPERFGAPAGMSWDVFEGSYQHPGWHYFDDVKTGKQTDGAYEAVFAATELGDTPIHMRALIPGGLETEMTQVNGPPTKGAPEGYRQKPLPAFVMRHQGDAWDNPFVAVYESYGDKPSVQSVERLMSGDVFKGVKVTSTVDGRDMTHYILLQEGPDDVYRDAAMGIAFQGHFGVVTVDGADALSDIYIGSGHHLDYKDTRVAADAATLATYWER
ncbi:MAG: hypothetical protein GY732_02100 [Gammaproteobacteria bacterium]|nr:hypothetical protein [Gammaproteobacteria bacterium]